MSDSNKPAESKLVEEGAAAAPTIDMPEKVAEKPVPTENTTETKKVVDQPLEPSKTEETIKNPKETVTKCKTPPPTTTAAEEHAASPAAGTSDDIEDDEEPNDVASTSATTAAITTKKIKSKRKRLIKKSNVPRIERKSKKKAKDRFAPKFPLTGYIRFMNVRREELRLIFPNATAIDLTKIIGDEWNKLSDDAKKPYLEAAEVDKERYSREILVYTEQKMLLGNSSENLENSDEAAITTKTVPATSAKQTNGTASKDPPQNGVKREVKPANNLPTITSTPATSTSLKEPPAKIQRTGDFDIPIFTDEFLEHNKTVDSELRALRKSNTDYEQQNSVLEKHVENMQNGIVKLDDETATLKENNQLLQNYIMKLRKKLSTALAGLSIPGEPNGANMQNIDKYMADLHQMATSNSHGPASLNKAKDIIRKLDLHIQL